VLYLFLSDSGSSTQPIVPPSPTTSQSQSASPSASPSGSASTSGTGLPTELPLPSGSGLPSGDPFATSATAVPTGPLSVEQARAAVNWTRFSAGTQEKVDLAAASANCTELEALRATALANDLAVQQSTGTGTADLVAYIDAQLRATGCTVP
jgi:hypothetical protein